MHRLLIAAAALVLATAARAAPADDVAGLAWMAGSWVDAKPGLTTRETWLAPLGGTMAGAAQANARGKPAFVEHMRISAEPKGATFWALVADQPWIPFVKKPGPEGEAVFENLAHDFPQRVIYRRCGADLCARIEGVVGGKLESQEWRYTRITP